MSEKKAGALPACPVETTLTLIGDKWKVLILRDFHVEATVAPYPPADGSAARLSPDA